MNFWQNVKQRKSVHVIEFLGKKTDWESWSEKFLLCCKWKGYKKLLLSSGPTWVMEKIPTQDEYKNAMEGDTDIDKFIIKLGEWNKLAYEDLILSIHTSLTVGKVAFGLVRNAKSADFPEGKCKNVLDRLVSKYASHTASSLLKIKSTTVS